MNQKNIFVTQPSLPALDDFLPYLREIWDSKWLTNMGRFHNELEDALCRYLGVPYISLFTNGTLALVTVLQALRITGEVITTPFSFVATTHALHWNGIKPVFCDVDPVYGNLDPARIEALISPKTTAILPVHVYGNPCDVGEIQRIADIYGLKVIYDAAHAFGVTRNGDSILNCGDLSVLSFHATKTFNTIEGGAIVCHDKKTKQRIDFLKNFGFADEVTVVAPGINAKMNELQAAYGLLQLKEIDENIRKRNLIAAHYRNRLSETTGIRYLEPMPVVSGNSSYFPVFIQDTYPLTRDELYDKLKTKHIFTRRYFYPLISSFPSYNHLESVGPEKLKQAMILANQVLCLPIYVHLDLKDVDVICELINEEIL